MPIVTEDFLVPPNASVEEVRTLWETLTARSKVIRNVEYKLWLPQNVRLEAPLFTTVFTNPGGGWISISTDTDGKSYLKSEPVHRETWKGH